VRLQGLEAVGGVEVGEDGHRIGEEYVVGCDFSGK
jgi:hypothetical protein